jgi:hypothetical protein
MEGATYTLEQVNALVQAEVQKVKSQIEADNKEKFASLVAEVEQAKTALTQFETEKATLSEQLQLATAEKESAFAKMKKTLTKVELEKKRQELGIEAQNEIELDSLSARLAKIENEFQFDFDDAGMKLTKDGKAFELDAVFKDTFKPFLERKHTQEPPAKKVEDVKGESSGANNQTAYAKIKEVLAKQTPNYAYTVEGAKELSKIIEECKASLKLEKALYSLDQGHETISE